MRTIIYCQSIIKKHINFLSLFTLLIAGAFKFIEPFFYFIDNRNTYFMIILLVLTGFNVIFNSTSKKDFNLKVSLLIVACALLVLGDMGLPYSICIAIVISTLPFKKALSIVLVTGLLLLIVDSCANIFFGFNSEYNFVGNSGDLRLSLGFSHPNTGPTYFIILFSGFILSINRHKALKYGALLLLSLFIFRFTISRSSILAIAITAILAIPIYFLAQSKRCYMLIPCIFPAFAIVSFLLGTIFNIQLTNDILSGRPYYYSLFIDNGSIAWITGRFITYPLDWYLDNLYLSLIYRISVIDFLLCAIGIFPLFKIAKQTMNSDLFFKLSLSFVLLMITSLTGDFLTTIYSPIYILLIVSLLKYENNKSFYCLIRTTDSKKVCRLLSYFD